MIVKYQDLPRDVVLQICPNDGDDFSGCYITVYECNKDTVLGYFNFPVIAPEGSIRVQIERKWEDVEIVGQCQWVLDGKAPRNNGIFLYKSENLKK